MQLSMTFASHNVLRKLYNRCVHLDPASSVVLDFQEAMTYGMLIGCGFGMADQAIDVFGQNSVTASDVIEGMKKLLPDNGNFRIGSKSALVWTLDVLERRDRPTDKVSVSLALHAGAKLDRLRRLVATESDDLDRMTSSMIEDAQMPANGDLEFLRKTMDPAVYDMYMQTACHLATATNALR